MTHLIATACFWCVKTEFQLIECYVVFLWSCTNFNLLGSKIFCLLMKHQSLTSSFFSFQLRLLRFEFLHIHNHGTVYNTLWLKLFPCAVFWSLSWKKSSSVNLVGEVQEGFSGGPLVSLVKYSLSHQHCSINYDNVVYLVWWNRAWVLHVFYYPACRLSGNWKLILLSGM